MKQLKTFSCIGRILFALPIGMMGLNHFLMTPLFAQQLKESLIPLSSVAAAVAEPESRRPAEAAAKSADLAADEPADE